MTKTLLEKKLIAAFIFLLFAALTPMQMMAQAKKVAYIQFSKTTMVSTASQTGSATVTGSDAITRMLTATGFDVTVYACDANGLDLKTSVNVDTEITGADLIIIQETWGSSAVAIKQAGILAIRKLSLLNKPVIYNKSFTFQNGRAISSTAPAAPLDTKNLGVTVVAGKETNPIYSGITIPGNNSIPLFNALSTDLGLLGDATSIKSISVVNNLEISTAGTLLATIPEANPGTNNSMLINHIPAGTQIGTDALDKLATKDMITFTFNFGTIAAGNGTNVTNEFLTIWRNAAYILTGQTVPTTLYLNPALGTKENTLASDSVSVSPNPTRGVVTVNSASAVKAITVYDATGKQVSTSKTNTVDLSNQAKGIYLVQVQTENGSTTKKVVVE